MSQVDNAKNMMHFFLSYLANSPDPDEMPHDAAFHLGLHGLLKYPFIGIQSENGLEDLNTPDECIMTRIIFQVIL